MKCSEEAIEAIRQFEGLKLKAYKCPGGVWTIGYGHTGNVKPNMVITANEALALLKKDLRTFEIFVESFYDNKTQNQFDALVSLIYNIGVGSFQNSTLKKKIDSNSPIEEIEKQWLRWIYSNGKILEGLKRRRKWEIERYKS